MKRYIKLSTITVSLILAMLLVAQFGTRVWKNTGKTTNGTVTFIDKPSKGHAQIGGSFKLVDHRGKARTDVDFRGKLMLVYFGYSYCPDICPMGLSAMSQALKTLTPDQQINIQPLFITVDPERDTPQHLAVYVQNYHKTFIALTGSLKAIESAKKAYRVHSQKAIHEDTVDYLVDHSSIIYLMDRQGRFLAHFNHQTAPDVIAAHLRKYL